MGRERELARLHACWRDAVTGHGSLVVVGADAGVGKTRLASEVVAYARRFGAHVAVGHCLEHARAPFGPLADVVRSLHASEPAVLLGAPAVRNVLARLIPELVVMPIPEVEGTGGARELYVALSEALRRFAERTPLIVVIEDAESADLSTLDCLNYLAGRLGAMRLLVLVLARSGPAIPDANAAGLAALRRRPNVESIDLRALTPAEMEVFFDAIGGAALDPTRLRTVRALADGNPLFAEELLAATAADPSLTLLPASIRDIFAQRIRELDPDDMEIIVEAAVLGRRFDPAFLAGLTGKPLDRILLALRHARERHLIVEDPEHPDVAVFRHALVRETLYGSILTAEARRLHRRIADELEALPDADRHLAARAYHAWASHDHPDASSLNERAGDRAMAQLATNEAALCYERALEATVDGERSATLRQKAGLAYSGSGMTSQAIGAFTQAHAYVERAGDVQRSAELCMQLGREYSARADGEAAIRWRTRAYDTLATAGDDHLKIEAISHLALMSAKRGNTLTARRFLAEAAQYTMRRPPLAENNLADAEAIVEVLDGRARGAFARYERCLDSALASAQLVAAVRATGNLSELSLSLGFLETADRASRRCVELVESLPQSIYRLYALAASTMVFLAKGQLDAARAQFSEADDAAAGIDSPRLYAHFAIAAVPLGYHVDDPSLVARYTKEHAIEDAFTSGESGWIVSIANAFIESYARSDRHSEAQALSRRAVGAIANLLYCPDFALTAATYGALDDIVTVRQLLTRWAGVAAEVPAVAYRRMFEALVESRLGRSPVIHAKAAAQAFLDAGYVLHAARAHELAGERSAADSLYARAGSAKQKVHLAAVRTPLDAIGASLTKREREVLMLVTRGRSNREIAGGMRISERTVESHVRSILAKVNGRSRADLIAMAGPHALR